MMTSRNLLLPLALAAMTFSSAAAFAETGIQTGDSALGPVLTDAQGMTLYTFDKDSGGVSVCYDSCAGNWPPLVAPNGAANEGGFTLVARTDGTKQWAYDGKPLYLWINDAAPGDVTGDGVGGVWHVAKP